jgi:hypothetical protein
MNKFDTLVTNALLSRAAFYNSLLDGKNEDRNIDDEVGYPESISIDDYVQMYRRQDIAQRVVTLEPEESWSEYPDIYETDEGRETAFEKAVSTFVVETSLHEYLAKVDTVSGIGQYAVLFIGLDDGGEFDTPAPGFTENGLADTPGQANVLYYRVFDQSSARISEYERDRNNPRYGQPKVYELDFQDTIDSTLDTNATPVTDTIQVHWSRVIHVADTRLTTSEIFGFPRMEPVFNRLFDVRKINAASGEAYWKGGFPGYAFEVDPQNGELSDDDREAIKDEIFKYEQGLSRYFAGVGVQVKPLTPTLVSPQPFIDNALRMIAAAKGYPITKLVGNYGGNQTNEQDEDAWKKKIAQRRELFVTPKIIRATINRIQQFGALPPTKKQNGKPRPYIVKWKPLAEMTEGEKAEIGLKRTEALARYTTAGAESAVPLVEWLTKFMGLRFEEAEAIAKAERSEFSPVLKELAAGMSGQQNNTPSSIPAVPKPTDTKDPSKTPSNQVQKENPANA